MVTDLEAPLFRLTKDGEAMCEFPLDATTQIRSSPLVIGELARVGFEIGPREADVEYSVRIGDVAAGTSDVPGTDDESGDPRGHARGRFVLWDDGHHFESARGLVHVQIESRRADPPGVWRRRGALPVYVLPTKLGEDRYQAMFDDLRRLSAGLVFDIVSRTIRSVGYTSIAQGISVRSAHLELSIIEKLWRSVGAALEDVARDPALALTRVTELRLCWGGERLGSDGLARLAASGVDPRRDTGSRPYPATCKRLRESADTLEHRVIVGFLQLILDRVRDCVRTIDSHVVAIKAERRYRERGFGTEPSLWEAIDRPRIQALRAARTRATRLEGRICQAFNLHMLRGQTAVTMLPRTPVFEHVPSYRRIRDEMLHYLRFSLFLLDEGGQERIKATSRMYEQWVYLQLVAALRESGLRCERIQGLVRRAAPQRYTLDLDRGTRVLFRAPDGRAISIRYEPWVFPATTARERGDTVCRGQSGPAPWSPDILIEAMAGEDTSGGPPDVEYAVVVDAKYSRRIEERHWATVDKYLQIRATRSGRQVVRQLWLAHPSDETGILCRDPTVHWTDHGPDRPRDETVLGALGLIPPPHLRRDEGGRATENAILFARGLLGYLGLDPKEGASEERAESNKMSSRV